MNDVKSSFGRAARSLCNSRKSGNRAFVKNDGLVPDDGLSVEKLADKYRDFLIFSTPGHKGQLCGKDVTEYDGGRLFPAFSVENACLKAARRYGVKSARLLEGGASMGIKAAIMAADADITAPLFTHVSAFKGARLAGKKLFTFDTGEKDGLPAVPTPEDYEKAFALYPSSGAALVTSPDYFGRCAPVKEIKKVCDRAGKILIADCAHGAHFASRPDLFPFGAEKIADMAVLSAHKTLRALTQTAIGVCNNPAFTAAFDDALDLLDTTSPSYLLLASLENAMEFERENAQKYDDLYKSCLELRKSVSCLFNDDPLRLAVCAAKYGLTGEELFNMLINKRIMPETYYGDYCVFIVTLSDSCEKTDALKNALKEILIERG